MLDRKLLFINIGAPISLFVFLLVWTSHGAIGKGKLLTIDFPSPVKDFTTIFLSIFLEAIPFVLLGVLVSSLIQIYISEEKLQRLLPKNPLGAVLPAVLLASIFPVCECAIIPVVKRLIQKGMPAHIGIIFLIITPIVNPIVFLSTHLAFRLQPMIVYGRMGLAIILALFTSLLVYLFSKKQPILKRDREQFIGLSKPEEPSTNQSKGWQALCHAVDEFFDVGKYVIMGALIAALAQTALNRSFIDSLGTNQWTSSLVMMGLSFILSICSEADAFVAASFSPYFPPGSLVAFLVFGAVLDVKNTLILFSVFRTRFVMLFIAFITVFVLAESVIFQHYIIHLK